MKFHINPQTGKIGKCQAKKGQCPFGNDSQHFPTREQATQHAQQKHNYLYKNNLYTSSSKTQAHNENKTITRHTDNIENNENNVIIGDKIVFNSWVGNKREELNRKLLQDNSLNVMSMVREHTLKDISSAIELGYVPKDMVYNVSVLEDNGFGERELSIEVKDPDKTSFEMKDFVPVRNRDGHYSIVPQFREEYINTSNKIGKIADNYNLRRKNQNGYYESDFYTDSYIIGGKEPISIDDNFNAGKKSLEDFYQGKITSDILREKVQEYYAHNYNKRVYEEIKKSNNILKQNSGNEAANDIVVKSLRRVEQEMNARYQVSTSITMNFLKGESINREEENMISPVIRKAKDTLF